MELRAIPKAAHTVKTSDIPDQSSLIVNLNGISIGIFKFNGDYYAYENVCPHQGGPACEGELFGNMVGKISPDGKNADVYTSKEDMNIVCPWHGIEFDLRTGVCRPERRLRLRKFVVAVEGDELKIKV